MKILVAPVHLDALTLPHDRVVRDALVDYTRLPHSDGTQDFNSDTPYVGEGILNSPFQDKNLLLQAGTHLHWAMPRGLHKTVGFPFVKKPDLDVLEETLPGGLPQAWTTTRETIWNQVLLASGWIKPLGAHRGSILDRNDVDQQAFDNGMQTLMTQLGLSAGDMDRFAGELVQLLERPLGSEFPGVPDAWLVQRKRAGTLERTWIVESGFVSETQSASQGNLAAVNVPFHDHYVSNNSQPYRFMGRQTVDTNGWHTGALQGTAYLEEVTAVGFNPEPGSPGHAETTFSAFYPHCASVFGLFDNEVTSVDTDLIYEVVGLYSNPENDCLSLFLQDFANRNPQGPDYFTQLNDALKLEFEWEMHSDSAINGATDVPEHAVLFAKAAPKASDAPDPSSVEVAVGHSGTEALSAYLGNKLPGDKGNNEDVLEAIQMSARLQNKALDVPFKFQEARHTLGFQGFAGGTIWTVVLESKGQVSASEGNQSSDQEVTLPASLADLLHKVNQLQSSYDQSQAEIISLRRQLFSDWHRYMISSYPPVDNPTFYFDSDKVLSHIEAGSCQQLVDKLEATGTLAIAQNANAEFESARGTGNGASLAEDLAGKLMDLVAAMATFNAALADQSKALGLRPTAAPRFYRPSDAVVLFAEDSRSNTNPALRNQRFAIPGAAGPDICHLIASPFADAADISIAEIQQLLADSAALFSGVTETGNAVGNWHPFMLEWKVEFKVAFPGSNHQTGDRNYASHYVQQHYELGETNPDLTLSSPNTVFSEGTLFSGGTILTPQASVELEGAITKFNQDHGAGQTAATQSLLASAKTELENTYVLAQSLGGLHEALLMHQQTRQLAVADPLGFGREKNFSNEAISALVGNNNISAPDPLGEFNPIRSGVMRLLNLRMIGSFGETLDFDAPAVIPSKTLEVEGLPNHIHLKPRLAQPARLNFRFLSAGSGEQEMNGHPATSPVCGWLLPNHLDRSIVFYDEDGAALGSITEDGDNPWRPIPNSQRTSSFDAIGNPTLRRVARYLVSKQRQRHAEGARGENGFVERFLNALDSAQENVDPENFTEHGDLALLMGEPIAVLRTRLDLQLEGMPATDQSWTQLGHELLGQPQATDDFTQVKFPVRLGEYRQLNDGLLGYWIEDAEGNLSDSYFSSEADVNPDASIETYSQGGAPLNLHVSLDDEPVYFTMLVDPKGLIHATSGILPVKSISVPRDQYLPALKRIGLTFLTAPVLSPASHLKLSLPSEAGFEWAWLENNGRGAWQKTSQKAMVSKLLFLSKFADHSGLWDNLFTRGWLTRIPGDDLHGLLADKVHRAYPPNATLDPHPFPADVAQRLDAFFDAHAKRIEPFDQFAALDQPVTIREGWLQLSPEPSSNSNN